MGGNSDAALRRVASIGDGWYGFNLTVAEAIEHAAALQQHCQRDARSLSDLSVAVALTDGDPGAVPALARAGVTEVVLVGAPPADPVAATTWVTGLAASWGLTPGQ